MHGPFFLHLPAWQIFASKKMFFFLKMEKEITVLWALCIFQWNSSRNTFVLDFGLHQKHHSEKQSMPYSTLYQLETQNHMKNQTKTGHVIAQNRHCVTERAKAEINAFLEGSAINGGYCDHVLQRFHFTQRGRRCTSMVCSIIRRIVKWARI